MFAPGAYLILRSSIVARNTRLGQPDDISSLGPVTIQGNGNLVIASSQPLPADTITTDPLLMPLADNGGPVATHALRPGSPAIDHGDNFLSLTYDARDAGFDRVVGAAADIGAYEVQAAGLDVIFADGFDVVFQSGVPRG
ncbi:MAG TPA: choice-of-anchor Q domain-containing protein [Dokdonella sp.]|nr:choice-of-anchor Q domain-containing protein [Dokdonella sp.]